MKKSLTLLILLAFAFVLMNCEAEDNPTIWDPEDEGAPTPSVSSVEPESKQYGGVGTKKLVTINGENFNPVADKNFVYFGNAKGDIVDASATQLKVAAPANYQDSLKLEVHSQGAYLPAIYGGADNPYPYELLSPMESPGSFTGEDKPGALCVDGENNLFVAAEKNIYKVTPGGHRTHYGQLVQPCKKMAVTPDGAIVYNYLNYVLKTDTTVFDPAESKPTSSYIPVEEAIKDFTYDSQQHLIVLSKSSVSVVDVVNEELLTEYFFEDYNFITGQVYNGNLYAYATYIGSDDNKTDGPYLLKIGVNASESTLEETVTELYNFDDFGYPGILITSMEITETGGLFLGTTSHSLLSTTDVESSNFNEAFPQILGEHWIHSFKWSDEEYIYINTKNGDDNTKTTILKLMVFEKSMDHYGR